LPSDLLKLRFLLHLHLNMAMACKQEVNKLVITSN
jgi:hypothetical protein